MHLISLMPKLWNFLGKEWVIKVHKCSDGKVYIYAKSFSTDYRTGKPEFMGYTIRQYTGSDLKNTKRKLIEITNC